MVHLSSRRIGFLAALALGRGVGSGLLIDWPAGEAAPGLVVGVPADRGS